MFSSKRLISLSVLSTFLTLALALPIEPPTCSTTRVVQSGDTCEAIANAAGIPVSTLLANNPAVNSGCTNLFIGQVLCTANQPTQPPPPPTTCSTTRVVQAGDTCEAIANAAGIPVSKLLANNPAVNSGCTNLFIGQVLCISSQTTPPPPPPPPTTCSITRVVQAGDTCETIANAASISVSTLLANNPAINSGCTNLFIGQVLCTAGQTITTQPPPPPTTCSTTRVVQAGDTCEAIANAAGIAVSTLLANNPAVNPGCSNLFIGQVLCIANKPTQPPTCTCSTTRVVQSGDTCSAIANFVGIPLSTLLANNPAVNSGCTNLSIGQSSFHASQRSETRRLKVTDTLQYSGVTSCGGAQGQHLPLSARPPGRHAARFIVELITRPGVIVHFGVLAAAAILLLIAGIAAARSSPRLPWMR
ncbi:hypothetical protein BC826DRAFT_1175232 [Russula brevipes]|nr:hypothetical protein BC826DRAFT_1175232 [Russula brevipes]